MPVPEPVEDDPLVCHCMKVRLSTLRLILRMPLRELHELMEQTGAGMGCGTCRMDLKGLLDERTAADNARPSQPHQARSS